MQIIKPKFITSAFHRPKSVRVREVGRGVRQRLPLPGRPAVRPDDRGLSPWTVRASLQRQQLPGESFVYWLRAGDQFNKIFFISKVDSIDECYSSPCRYGGTCVDEVLSFRCECPPGVGGLFCETGQCVVKSPARPPRAVPQLFHLSADHDDCESAPCLHGGVCRDAGRMKFECTCSGGYGGDTCEISESSAPPRYLSIFHCPKTFP